MEVIRTGLAITVTTAVAWLARPSPRAVHHATVVPVLVPIVVAPAVIERIVEVPAAPARCPVPRTDAPAGRPTRVPATIEHIRPSSTNAGWIAAWNATHVYLSSDGGATWQRRLDGATPVQDVAFDCFGRAVVLRRDVVGIADGARERWRPLAGLRPMDGTLGVRDGALLGGGPDVVVIGHSPDDTSWVARLAVSHDLGATWRTHDIGGGGWESGIVRGRQYEDGEILAMVAIADCMHDTPLVVRWRAGELTTIGVGTSVELALLPDRVIGNTGWHRFGRPLRAHAIESATWPQVIEGARPLIVTSDAVYRTTGPHLTRLPWRLAGDERDLASDAAGRLWTVRCGQPDVASRAAPSPCVQ